MDPKLNDVPKLQDDVSAKYELVGCKPGKHRFADYGEIDLTKMTARDAKTLVASGFPYLKLKAKASTDESTASEPKAKK